MVSLFLRDLALFARGGGFATGLIFFLALVVTIPFGIGPDLALLSRIGPAILWIGVLMATLLSLDRLFQADREDGTLDALILGPVPMPLVVLVKCAALWCAAILPLVVAAPVLGLFLAVEPAALGAVAATLLVGSPAVVLVGAIGAAIAISLPRGGVLVSVLVLPLTVPILIFGVTAAYGAVNDPAPFREPFLVLCGLSLFFAVLGPVAAAHALRMLAD